ncbi:MAG: hypothetical protein SFU99_08035, partial [Saprospiraceae bacterium]|nr:hypothetical protein [Saprospiraceae bacterium]
MNYIEELLSELLKTGLGKIIKLVDDKLKFQRDLQTFKINQEEETQLDVFRFPDLDFSLKPSQIELEKIYIPLRADQEKATLPERAIQVKNFEAYEGLENQLIEDMDIARLLELMRLDDNFKKILIVGSAGSGKSTFLKYLTQL